MTTLSPQTVQKIRDMRAAGHRWYEIQDALDLNYHTARSAVDSDYRERRNIKNAAAKRELSRGKIHTLFERAPVIPRKDVEKRREWMLVEDRRDLTAVMFGDPPTGRSALDQRQP